MAAPSIEAITASLRNIALGGRRVAQSQQQRPAQQEPQQAALPGRRRTREQEGEEFGEITVELNSDVALPYHWEQCLDLRTGLIYYINWKDGTRTTDDPRLTTTSLSRTSYYTSEEYETSNDGADDEAEEDDEDNCGAEDSSSSASGCADNGDYFGMGASNADASTGGHVLVAAGCKSCFMYFMVPKLVQDCPKCSGCLLHLGRNGYF